MLLEQFDKPAIPEILGQRFTHEGVRVTREYLASYNSRRRGRPVTYDMTGARDFITLCDLPGLVKLVKQHAGALRGNGVDPDTLAHDLTHGDDLKAAEMERVISNFDSRMLLTNAATFNDDVQGAVPNVPAFLSGNPFNMRTKKTIKSGKGPLALFLELTGSSGFSAQDMIRRGAAMLAMTRQMALARPLEFWLTITFGGRTPDNKPLLTMTAIRMDAQPLDLARAAVAMTSYLPMICTGSLHAKKQSGGFGGTGWAYNIPNLERTYGGEILGRVISPGTEIAYLPAALTTADNLTDPEAWIKTMLQKYSGYLLEGEERDDNVA